MCTHFLRTVVFLLLLHATIPPAVHASEQVVLSAPEKFDVLIARCGPIVVAAYRRIGLDACILRLPLERSLRTANHGLVTGELIRVQDIESFFPNLVRVPETICRSHIVAFTKGDKIEIKGRESLSHFRIGRVIGIKVVEKMLASLNVYAVVTVDSLMKMLDYGRIDVAVTEQTEARQTIDRLGLTDIREVDPPLGGLEFFTYVHSDRADLVPGLTSALSAMTEDGTKARLIEQGVNPLADTQTLVCE